jgi:hypothetical protein
VRHEEGTEQGIRRQGSPDRGGDAEVEEELRPSGAPMATTASGGLQRPGGDPTAPVMEREVRSGPKRGKRGSRTVLTMA